MDTLTTNFKIGKNTLTVNRTGNRCDLKVNNEYVCVFMKTYKDEGLYLVLCNAIEYVAHTLQHGSAKQEAKAFKELKMLKRMIESPQAEVLFENHACIN
jgi:hypothetical protein